MTRIAALALAAPRRVLAIVALVTFLAALLAATAPERLSAGGFEDPGSESAQANSVLTDTFGRGDLQLVFTVTSPSGALGPEARAVADDLVDRLRAAPYVSAVASAWTAPAAAASTMLSSDGATGLVIAGIVGEDGTAVIQHAKELGRLSGDYGAVRVRAGGAAAAAAQITAQTTRDLLIIEAVAIPLSFLALVWVFGGALAALLPVLVGLVAITGSVAVLRGATGFTEVSTLALNVSVAMALALAIDYTLLIVNRYRDEVADGQCRHRALVRTVDTAGRTVVFSAITVALSILGLLAFPMAMLRSFAYAGFSAVAIGAVAAIVVTPCAIVLLGTRLDALDARRALRRLLGRPERPAPVPVRRSAWYRGVVLTMRHRWPVGIVVVVVLLVLGAPFLHAQWGFPDDRVLPATAPAREVGDILRNDFPTDPASEVIVVVPDAGGLTNADYADYAAQLSRVPDVVQVSAPAGTFVGGVATGPPVAPTAVADGKAFLTVGSAAAVFSEASESQLTAIGQVAGPGGRSVILTGLAQINRDTAAAINSRLPWVLPAIVLVTLLLLFMLTGSVVLPLKALVCNAMSLTAAFGALVWIFQDGNLGALGTAATGTLVAAVPVLLFCVAFGLSMDYEVFLLARIREYWLASGRTRADNDESVALGVARTGRVVTAAALLMVISFGALTTANVSIIRMFAFGLVLAVAVDVTMVRMLLVPVVMSLMGRANWWAPARLARAHARLMRAPLCEHEIRSRRRVGGPAHGAGSAAVARGGRHRRI